MTGAKKFYVIIGLGKTGLSCVKFALRQGWHVAVTDSRMSPPGLDELKKLVPQIETVLGEISAELLNKADQLIVSPGVDLRIPAIADAIKRGIPCCGDVEIFLQNISAPVVAVTGSNAKSTVTTLVGQMAVQSGLNAVTAGNIGTPVLDLLSSVETRYSASQIHPVETRLMIHAYVETSQKPADLYVLELSSFQLATTSSLAAAAATVLNISEDHMDRHPDMEDYIAAKHIVYKNSKVNVVNYDDVNTWTVYKTETKEQLRSTFESWINHLITTTKESIPFHSIFFSLANDKVLHCYHTIEDKENTYLAVDGQRLLNTNEMQIFGKHNIENALAAIALGDAVNLSRTAMLQVLKEFKGLAHRCQLVHEHNGVKWYDDSKGTNVGASLAAIEGLGKGMRGKIILIAGGLGKGADFSPLKTVMPRLVKHVILMGEAADEMYELFHRNCDITRVNSMQEAVQVADKVSHPNDIVLLSPACASFDMFKDYVHRGEEFVKFVKLI